MTSITILTLILLSGNIYGNKTSVSSILYQQLILQRMSTIYSDSEIPEAIKNQLGINIAYTTRHTEIILLLTKMIDYGL